VDAGAGEISGTVRAARSRDGELWLEIRGGEWARVTPAVVAALAGFSGIPETAIEEKHGPVRRVAGGPRWREADYRARRAAPDPVCERCGTQFPSARLNRNSKWCPACWALVPDCLKCGGPVGNNYAYKWLRGETGDNILCRACADATAAPTHPPGPALIPAAQLRAAALAWLAGHPASSTEQIADVIGCTWGRANRVLQAAREDGAVKQRRSRSGPDRGRFLWSLAVAPLSGRRRTCPWCGRPVIVTRAGTLRLHRPRAGDPAACTGSGTAPGETPAAAAETA
jgi:hypothetical protein